MNELAMLFQLMCGDFQRGGINVDACQKAAEATSAQIGFSGSYTQGRDIILQDMRTKVPVNDTMLGLGGAGVRYAIQKRISVPVSHKLYLDYDLRNGSTAQMKVILPFD